MRLFIVLLSFITTIPTLAADWTWEGFEIIGQKSMQFMRNIFFILLFSFSQFSFAKIVVFGDSLAYGEGGNIDINGKGDLHRCLERNLKEEVINHGVVGATTEDVYKEQLRKVLELNPRMVVLSTGGNDAMKHLFDGDFPEELSYRYLELTYSELALTNIEVIHMGLEVIDQETNKPSEWARRLPLMENIANKFKNVIFIPKIMQGFWGDEDMMPDGIHPIARGYEIMCQRILKMLE